MSGYDVVSAMILVCIILALVVMLIGIVGLCRWRPCEPAVPAHGIDMVDPTMPIVDRYRPELDSMPPLPSDASLDDVLKDALLHARITVNTARRLDGVPL